MFKKITDSIQQATGVLKEQALSLGDAAKAKGNSIVDEWISNIPGMEAHGLKVYYFSLGVSISPVLELEMKGDPDDFSMGKINGILAEVKGNTPLTLVFTSIKTMAQLNERAKLEPNDPLIVCLRVRLSPEIKVSFGVPLCE